MPAVPGARPEGHCGLNPDPALVLSHWKTSGHVADETRLALRHGAMEYARVRAAAPFGHDYQAGLRDMMIIMVVASGRTRPSAAIIVDRLIAEQEADHRADAEGWPT